MLEFFKLLLVCLIFSLCLMLSSEVADRSVKKKTFISMWISLAVMVIVLKVLYV